VFVQNAIREAITDQRLDLLERNIEYHLQIADVVERFGYERAHETSELTLLITSGNCGYLEIREALEVLERNRDLEQRSIGSSPIPSIVSCVFTTTMTP